MNRLAMLLGLVAVVAGCGDSASSSRSPAASDAAGLPSGPPSGAPVRTASVPPPSQPPTASVTLAPFAPGDRWEPVLELTSDPDGTDTGTFQVRGRYRLHQQCLGEGRVKVTVATAGSEPSVTEVACGPTSQPQNERVRDVRGQATVTVSVAGDPEWLLVFQVPRGD
ncbi:hypothetical protein BH20CHL5_BH20CHL5_00770 [soil metagenome]|nr:hypothetical protein [Chloroflexota bacterium]